MTLDGNEQLVDEGINEMIIDWFTTNTASENVHDDNTTELQDSFHKLTVEANTPLFDGSNISRLSAVLLLLNLQAQFGWSNNSVSALFRYILIFSYVLETQYLFVWAYSNLSVLCDVYYSMLSN